MRNMFGFRIRRHLSNDKIVVIALMAYFAYSKLSKVLEEGGAESGDMVDQDEGRVIRSK